MIANFDNRINKINKRIASFREHLGEYNKPLMNLLGYVNHLSTIDKLDENGNIVRYSPLAFDKSNHSRLTRSKVVWNEFTEKYGEERIEQLLTDLESFGTYQQYVPKVHEEYAELFNDDEGNSIFDDTTVREKAERIAGFHSMIARAFEYLYEWESKQMQEEMYNKVLNKESRKSTARSLLEESVKPMSEQERNAFNKKVLLFTNDFLDGEPVEESEYEEDLVEWRLFKANALKKLNQVRYAYKKRLEANEEIAFPIDLDSMEKDMEKIHNSFNPYELSKEEIQNILFKWGSF